jgi:YNFM family putative membrane transporter
MPRLDRQLSTLMFILGASVYLQVYDVQSLLPEVANDLSTSTASASLVVAFTTAGMALSVLPWSYISDRLGRVQVLCLCLLLGTILSLVTLAMPGLASLLIIRLLKGVFFGGITGIAVAFIFERASSATWATVISGIYISGNTVGGVVTRFSTSLLSPVIGWRGSLAAVSGLSLLLAALFITVVATRFTKRPVAAQNQPHPPTVATLLKTVNTSQVVWNYWQGFVALGVFNALFTVLPFQVSAQFTGTHAIITSILLSLYALAFFSAQFSGRLSARLGYNRLLILGYALALVGLALLIIQAFIAYLAGVSLIVLGMFLVHPLNSAESARKMQKARSQSTAIYQLFWLLGATVLSFVASFALEQVSWLAAVLLLFAFVVSGALAAFFDRSHRV